MSASKQLVGLLVAAALASGCGSSATLRLRGGGDVSGRIVRSDQDTITVEQDNGEHSVKRDDIVDVEHSGSGAMVAGGVLLGIAGLFALAALSPTESDEGSPSQQEGRCEGGMCGYGSASGAGAGILAGVLAVPGLGLETYGLVNHLSSRSRYAPPTTEPSSPMKDAKGVRLRFEF